MTHRFMTSIHIEIDLKKYQQVYIINYKRPFFGDSLRFCRPKESNDSRGIG